MNAPAAPQHSPPGLPLVVQLGFAGSRVLFDAKAYPNVDLADFHGSVELYLTQRLRNLASELGLHEKHFFCGLSQLAIGADTLFTRACQTLKWPQRFFLPQQHEVFLDARGPDGTPDFTTSQRDEARALFASAHVIQERVVSDSSDRTTRFQDVNLELVSAGDLMVCLVDELAVGKPGGTRELMENAERRQRALLVIAVGVGSNGMPKFKERWHNRESFAPPSLPEELTGLSTSLVGIHHVGDYCPPLKDFASREADWKQTLFKISALLIIGTHVVATILAVGALVLHGVEAQSWLSWLPWLLGGELLLLAVGFATHQYLHRSHAGRVWAMARLVAEIARSVLALRMVSGYLAHLVSLPLPTSLRPLLRTLNVLHLRETRALSADSWPERRDKYVESRLTNDENGQISYYERKLKGAEFWNRVARVAFFTGSGFAILATLGELSLAQHWVTVTEAQHQTWTMMLGPLAIILPVIAVAALSLAASFDLEARLHTYREMLELLRIQKEHMHRAASERAFCSVVLETEARLLGENVSWYYRRSFTGVT